MLYAVTQNSVQHREKRQLEQVRYYTAYAKELRDKFESEQLFELTPYKQFTVWKAVKIEDKWKKPPYNPRTHRLASPTDPSTWGTLEDALCALQSGAYNGINFVFTETDPFVGIDLDHCVHDNRRIDYRQEQLIRQIGSYAEYSPRDGLHLLVKAKLPITTRKHNDIEIFNSRHTLSLTLKHIPGTPFTIEDRQAELDALLQTLSSPQTEHPSPTLVWQREPQRITEVERSMLEHWKTQPGNFKRYYEGDQNLWTGSEKLVNSKSEADFVLCLMLLTRTHDDTEQVKRLFCASGLFDPLKTDRITGHDPNMGRPVTYLEMTIFNALKKREIRVSEYSSSTRQSGKSRRALDG